MIFNRPLKFLAALVTVVGISSILSVAVTTKNFSESYPAVVCPPTLDGLGSQISLSSKKTPFQRLQNRTTKTVPVKVLRLPVNKDSLVISSEGATPVVWQSWSVPRILIWDRRNYNVLSCRCCRVNQITTQSFKAFTLLINHEGVNST